MGPKIGVSNNLRFFFIDIDEIFPMQSSEIIKSLYFGSNLKKNMQQNKKNNLFHIKIDFYA